MRSILLLTLGARCIETIDVCIWHMFVFMTIVANVYALRELYHIILTHIIIPHNTHSQNFPTCYSPR